MAKKKGKKGGRRGDDEWDDEATASKQTPVAPPDDAETDAMSATARRKGDVMPIPCEVYRDMKGANNGVWELIQYILHPPTFSRNHQPFGANSQEAGKEESSGTCHGCE